MIDDGQAVDIRGISEKSLSKHLRMLFLSLNLKENKDRVFLHRPKDRPTLDVDGTFIQTHLESKELQPDESTSGKHVQPEESKANEKLAADDNVEIPGPNDDSPGPKRRVIGLAMPSAELLAAATKLTEAQAQLRDAELEEDTEFLFSEAATANEAERFKEVRRAVISGEAVGERPLDRQGADFPGSISKLNC